MPAIYSLLFIPKMISNVKRRTYVFHSGNRMCLRARRSLHLHAIENAGQNLENILRNAFRSSIFWLHRAQAHTRCITGSHAHTHTHIIHDGFGKQLSYTHRRPHEKYRIYSVPPNECTMCLSLSIHTDDVIHLCDAMWYDPLSDVFFSSSVFSLILSTFYFVIYVAYAYQIGKATSKSRQIDNNNIGSSSNGSDITNK